MPSQYGRCGKVLLLQRQHTVTDDHLATVEGRLSEEKPGNLDRNAVLRCQYASHSGIQN